MIKNVKIVIILAFKSKFYQYFVFTRKILHRFVSFYTNLIFTYCLFVKKKLVTIKLFLFNFSGGHNVWQNGNFCLYFENSRKFFFLLKQNQITQQTFEPKVADEGLKYLHPI